MLTLENEESRLVAVLHLKLLHIVVEFAVVAHHSNLVILHHIFKIKLDHLFTQTCEVALDLLFGQLVIRLVESVRFSLKQLFKSSVHLRH